jgi:hypothetical protein
MAAVYSILCPKEDWPGKEWKHNKQLGSDQREVRLNRSEGIRRTRSLHFPPSPLGESFWVRKCLCLFVGGRKSLCLCRRHWNSACVADAA